MQETARRPWGVNRMRPYPTTDAQPFVSVTIDPANQTGVFRDSDGLVVEMGKHGTSKGTETSPQSTNLDSRNDSDHDQDSTQD
ncbi:putative ATP-grasp-modified RiPP [Streptomyces sp. NBC_01198]|uniref:putative ATP-grasp-modified RiPP n=1 Tax=Streptomyces sp. NBC_01198 TaxID=2903769 RepID=UPI002E1387F7|nr:putative ATP-grasp-modified RiPP [Streptomyces sp. NBC_01198]